MAINIKQGNGNKPLPRKQRVINRGLQGYRAQEI